MNTADDRQIVAALAAAIDANEGLLSVPAIKIAASRFVREWRRYDDDLHDAIVLTSVDCPMCGSPAGRFCISSGGNYYNLEYGGPVYVHAARRRDPSTGPGLQLVQPQPDQQATS
jgi:hypothetical protein